LQLAARAVLFRFGGIFYVYILLNTTFFQKNAFFFCVTLVFFFIFSQLATINFMCGIFSVFHNPVTTPTCLAEMWNAQGTLKKRGPDSSTIIMNQKEFLAFHRLAIVDTSTAGNQPFFSNDKKIAVMCNGEIYNYKELIEAHGLHCTSGSDCEVILRLYEKLGFRNMVSKLDGVFAIVLRDYSQNKVYVARDYIGVRPLFQGITKDNSLAFASVASSLLSFCQPGSVKQYPASHWSCFDLTKTFPEILDSEPVHNPPPVHFKEHVTSLRYLLFNAVEKRLQGDRPVGCLLSGGLDSSIVASILVHFLGSENVRTYSIGLKDPEHPDEQHRSLDCRYAQKVAEYLGTVHTEVSFTPQDGFEVIPEVIEQLETYDITTVRASVPMYILSQYIKENTQDTIIFSGEGSDELFGGYLYFKKAPSLTAFLLESKNLVKELPYFDVLRADRCISSNGLEPRVPFLDIHVVEFANTMGEVKCSWNNIEKIHLRTCFVGDLPEEVLWRRKDGLSDGCSGVKSWATYIQELVEERVSDAEFVQVHDSFPSKEAYYYKCLYNVQFSKLTSNCPHYWMPKWTGNSTDPSGRLLEASSEW
jgi:asparagine synthase (glutamine-hydrolysing)